MSENKAAFHEYELRKQIIATCIRMNESGLNQGTSGNISVRHKDKMLITPTGMVYQEMVPEDIVTMSIEDGKVLSDRKPSSEWRFHRDILLNRKEVNVVLHNHSRFATAIAMTRTDIEAYHYMVAVSGGESIRCADYATFGTSQLSKNILKALEGRNSCLLANHGVVVTAQTPDKAFALAVEVENLAAQLIYAKMIGIPHKLDEQEMGTVIEKFKSYGVQPSVKK